MCVLGRVLFFWCIQRKVLLSFIELKQGGGCGLLTVLSCNYLIKVIGLQKVQKPHTHTHEPVLFFMSLRL
jgi:hypothetical protein